MKINPQVLFALVAVGLIGMSGAAAFGQASEDRPNIIMFLVDDMGWLDSTPYGSQYYETPNMQRLSEQGMLFTDAYSAHPLCSPTRASIMTGKYPARLGFVSAAGHKPPLPPGAARYPERAASNRPTLQPIAARNLDPDEYTIAEAFSDAGYATAHMGKWHLGLNPEHWPEAVGFQVSFHGAPDPGPRSYFSPYQFKAGTVEDGPDGEYITDRLTDEAVAFIEANQSKPFLLHLWHYGVHGPWGHKEEITQRYRDKKDPRGLQNNPIMASMLQSVDESLGRVVNTLDRLGLTENTIIIFFSDNGGNVHSLTGPDQLPATNNAPLRAGKGRLYEGGIRVPLIVRWPGAVKPGSRSDEIVSSIDLYPTMLKMAGLAPRDGQVLDGISIVPSLKQEGSLEREALFNYFPNGGPSRPPGVTVRQGDWKLIRWYETYPEFPDQYELYNLKDDIGEQTNLAAQKPELVAQLNQRIDRFLADTNALIPKPNPSYNPGAPSQVEGGEKQQRRAQKQQQSRRQGNADKDASVGAEGREKPVSVESTQKGPGNRENPLAELGLTQEQQKNLQRFQESMRAEMQKARESRDREKIQAVQKKHQAGLAKILDEEQMKKYKAAVAKIREVRQRARLNR